MSGVTRKRSRQLASIVLKCDLKLLSILSEITRHTE